MKYLFLLLILLLWLSNDDWISFSSTSLHAAQYDESVPLYKHLGHARDLQLKGASVSDTHLYLVEGDFLYRIPLANALHNDRLVLDEQWVARSEQNRWYRLPPFRDLNVGNFAKPEEMQLLRLQVFGTEANLTVDIFYRIDEGDAQWKRLLASNGQPRQCITVQDKELLWLISQVTDYKQKFRWQFMEYDENEVGARFNGWPMMMITRGENGKFVQIAIEHSSRTLKGFYDCKYDNCRPMIDALPVFGFVHQLTVHFWLPAKRLVFL